jgi:hypothetical protein
MSLSIDASLKTLRQTGIGFSADNGLWRLSKVALSSPELVLFAELLQLTRRKDCGDGEAPPAEPVTP